jgi:hypothetical protein
VPDAVRLAAAWQELYRDGGPPAAVPGGRDSAGRDSVGEASHG